ncbi:diadenylate cyclase CdaA (plasmid) [Rossellomorea sp. AcN35-11]|nr:diadenylate cyclase CdaA [Rossellomorea aquimaris]WJV31831.1 diadenylate cyclase CdaA [Rossellomorea sp. AcN35-11]
MVLDITLAIVDLLIVTFLLYKTIMIFHNTKAIQILKGIVVILIVWVASGVLGLNTLKFIISQLSLYGILALIILFQPEIRNALEKLGRKNFTYKSSTNKESHSNYKLIEDIIQSSTHMSKHKIGALICIELEDSLSEYVQTGIELNSKTSKELLISIFSGKVPLHDGALIIRGGRAEAASCFLPLSGNNSLSKELGTRHRAGVGLSELSDALTVIVSEETGSISVTKDHKLHRGVSLEVLRNLLEESLIEKKEKPKIKPFLKGGFRRK